MIKRAALALALLYVVSSPAQQTIAPRLKLAILLDKEQFTLNERVTVRSELTNLTEETLCLPPPDEKCSTPGRGWLIVTGYSVESGEGEQFICHVDERGMVGAELDHAIRHEWIKLKAHETYKTEPTEAQVQLSAAGNWKLEASYHPPEGSFSARYKTLLKTAARKAGCVLPESTTNAESRLITVSAGK